MSYNIRQIAALLGLEYRGDGDHTLKRVSKWETADADALVFLDGGESGKLNPESLSAGCIIVIKSILSEFSKY